MHLTKPRTYVLTALAILLGTVQAALCATGLINFQGRLLDANKLPRSGSFPVTFRICDSQSDPCSGTCQAGNACLWSETQTVSVSNGIFSVHMGSVNVITPEVFTGEQQYMEITVGSETLSPRERLTATPYSFRSGLADALGPLALTESQIADGAVTTAKMAQLPSGTLLGNDGAAAAAPQALTAAESKTLLALDNVTNDKQIPASLGGAKGELVGFSAAATPAAVAAGNDGDSLIADSAEASGVRWGNPEIPWYNAALSADVRITSAGTWYDGPSLTLPAGTWFVTGHVTLVKTATTVCNWVARISDGTTHYASGQAVTVSNNPQGATITMSTVISLSAQTAIKLQATAATGATTVAMKAATNNYGSGNNATQITAIALD